jgi:hypothetical protein
MAGQIKEQQKSDAGMSGMKKSNIFLAVLVIGSWPAMLSAQSQPKRDDSVTRTSMRWQLPDDRRGMRTAPILLLSREDVATDLGLSADQRAKTWEKINELGQMASKLKGKNDEDSLKLKRQVDQMQLDWLKQNLKPEQLSRLTQIDLQWEGPSSIVTRPQVTEAMHLTPDQKKKVQEIVLQLRARKTPQNPDEALAELTRNIFSQLDETQQQAWRSLTGPDLGQIPRTASAK